MRSKVTVVGAGNVGASCAQLLAQRDYADVVLVDIIEGMPQVEGLTLRHTLDDIHEHNVSIVTLCQQLGTGSAHISGADDCYFATHVISPPLAF